MVGVTPERPDRQGEHSAGGTVAQCFRGDILGLVARDPQRIDISLQALVKFDEVRKPDVWTAATVVPELPECGGSFPLLVDQRCNILSHGVLLDTQMLD